MPGRRPDATAAALLVAVSLGACGDPGPGGSGAMDAPAATAVDAPAETAVNGAAPAPEEAVVRTTAGLLRGMSSSEARADPTTGAGRASFLGIPYAKAPVGARRWRPPEPPESWDGVRDATVLGPSCPQPPTRADFFRRVARRLGGDPDAVPPLGPQSEDCLYLNVWTPRLPGPGRTGSGAGLPVLFWIHGGSGTIGSASVPLFDGRRLASRGAVVVTVNYRLGPLGFLAHPALSVERASSDQPEGVSGNYALLDLVRALEWVRSEIPAFGGDPDEVAVIGQSAGAALISHLLVTPRAEGLFRGAILQSGTGLGLALPLRRDAGAPEGPSGESIGRALASAVGVDTIDDVNTIGRVAAALRAVPPARLIEAGLASGAMPDRPVFDGRVVPGPLDEMLREGRGRRVPVIVGTNSLEAAVLVPPPGSLQQYRRTVEEEYGEDAAEILSLYPAADSASAARALRLRITDEWFSAPARRFADLLAEAGHPVRLYRFDRPVPAPRGEEVGAFHGAEMPFLFGNAPESWRAPETVSALLADAWIRFAATGDPGDPVDPDGAVSRWPVHPPGGASEVLFFRDEPSVGPLPRQRALDLFDERAAEPDGVDEASAPDGADGSR